MPGPKCPNHDVELIRTGDKGIGICPVSAARFEFDEVEDEGTDDSSFELVIIGGKYVKKKKRSYKITKGSEEGHDWNLR